MTSWSATYPNLFGSILCLFFSVAAIAGNFPFTFTNVALLLFMRFSFAELMTVVPSIRSWSPFGATCPTWACTLCSCWLVSGFFKLNDVTHVLYVCSLTGFLFLSVLNFRSLGVAVPARECPSLLVEILLPYHRSGMVTHKDRYHTGANL